MPQTVRATTFRRDFINHCFTFFSFIFLVLPDVNFVRNTVPRLVPGLAISTPEPSEAFGVYILPLFHIVCFVFCVCIYCILVHMTWMYFSALIFTATMLNVYDCIILLILLFANAKTGRNKE